MNTQRSERPSGRADSFYTSVGKMCGQAIIFRKTDFFLTFFFCFLQKKGLDSTET